MKKIFREEKGETLEVYMDNMIMKLGMEKLHTQHLHQVFKTFRQYNMRLNHENCSSSLRARKYLGFYLIERGIEANLDKCKVIIQMKAPTSNNDIKR